MIFSSSKSTSKRSQHMAKSADGTSPNAFGSCSAKVKLSLVLSALRGSKIASTCTAMNLLINLAQSAHAELLALAWICSILS